MADFPFTVAPLDPEMFVLRSSSTHEVQWILELDWTYQGREGTVTVDAGGQPFRVHPANWAKRWSRRQAERADQNALVRTIHPIS